MRRIFRSPLDLLIVVPIALLAFVAATRVRPPQAGLAAIAVVFEAHLLLLVLILLTPIALLARARTLGLALAMTAVVAGGLFGSEWISLPGSGGGRSDLSVVTWNLQYGARSPAETAAQLEGVHADLVALQELERDPAMAIENDAVLAARYPYRAMAPRVGAQGLAVLSRYPIEKVESSVDPACLELVVDTPRGPVRVIDAHPLHADISKATRLRLPNGYDPSERHVALAMVRVRIDAALARGDRLLVLGDFNTAPTEREYSVLSSGLRDTHVEVGEGPGWTWRPGRLTFLPLAFLRIDLQLTAGAVVPVSTGVDCSHPGDHCRLSAAYQID